MLDWLRLPEALGLDLDQAHATLVHAEILRRKPFLRRLYVDWYEELRRASRGVPPGRRLEIGSGPGFIKSVIPECLTSDLLPLPHVDLQCDAERLPFEDGSLSAIFMVNCLHHVPAPAAFLGEADRALARGGRLLMIEPANTVFGRFIYRHFHHEPFDPNGGWEIERGRPLSHSNGALPWILFVRDRAQLERRFPRLRLRGLRCHTPFRYLLSGGFSLRSLLPACGYPLVAAVEALLSPLAPWLGLFMTLEVEKAS